MQWVIKTIQDVGNGIVKYVNGRFERARGRHDALEARVAAIEIAVFGKVQAGELTPVPDVFLRAFEDDTDDPLANE